MRALEEALSLTLPITRSFEGVSLHPYHDPVGLPTIGYGHLLSHIAWQELEKWPPIDMQTAEDLLVKDLQRSAKAVLSLIKIDLYPGQLAAILDFTFNVGAGNFQLSTLRRLINGGEFAAVPEQLRRWVFARAVRLPGLVRRRQAEIELWRAHS
jgi:lysozyme